MSREDLIAKISEDVQITKKAAAQALTSVLEGIQNELADGGKVSLVGFGTFSVVTRAARQGINPRTKEAIEIPERKVPVFKAGKKLREAVK